ncbi:MAG: CBS domain-containing protein, partial [Candidatus Acidiferrales bacterium]
NLQEFVDTSLLRTGKRCYAVEDRGRLVGLITPRDVGAIPRELWDRTTVRDAMRPLERLHIITPDTQVLDALNLMAGNDVNQLPVVANGTLQGIFSRAQLMQLLQARSELQLSAAHYPPITAHK